MGFLFSAALLALAAVITAGATRRASSLERRVVWASFGGHILSAIAQVAMVTYYYGGGDMLGYQRAGRELAGLMRSNFAYAPEVLAIVLGDSDVRLPTTATYMAGTPTGSMMALSAWLQLLVGDGLLTQCLFFAMAAFFGKVALYIGLRRELSPSYARNALFACLLVPSAVFWSSGMLKEAVAVAGFGAVVFGVSRLFDRKLIGGMLTALTGGLFVVLIKPYIMAAFVASAALWTVSHRAARQGRVLKGRHIVVGGAAAVVGALAAGELFPKFSVSELGSALEQLQTVGQRISGGSNFSLGTGGASLGGQIALAPLALATALFRPLPFEVGESPLLVLGALEATFFTGLLVRALIKNGGAACVRLVSRHSELLFATTFVVLFGVAVGLASANFGTLGRYRVPMMPFFVFVLLCLNTPAEERPRSSLSDPMDDATE